MKVIPETHRAH